MSNKRDLKHFIRYDGNGRVIPGGNILQRKKPAVGKWTETSAYECCTGCAALVYGVDFTLIDIEWNGEGGTLILVFATAPGVSIQGAFIGTYPECNGEIIASVIIPEDAIYPWIVSFDEILFIACGLQFRRICTSGYSAWYTEIFEDGENN
jgi:hypothetical protein